MKTDYFDAPAVRQDLAKPALKAFFNICDKWELTTHQAHVLLGRPAQSTFYRWRRQRTGRLSNDALERISYVLAIYKALHILFATPTQADGWIRRTNMASLFAGASALDRMMGGQVADLYVVRKYLDAQRG